MRSSPVLGRPRGSVPGPWMSNLASYLFPRLPHHPGRLSPVHLRVESSDWVPELISLQLKFSSQNSANQMFLRLFSRERVMKYWSNPEREEGAGWRPSEPADVLLCSFTICSLCS